MKRYLSPEMDVITFAASDVIATSNPVDNEPDVYAAPITDYDLF